VFIGSSSGTNNSGANNCGFGYQALSANTTGTQNTAVGVNALVSNTTGANNSAVGLEALYSNTIGVQNSAVGVDALFSNTTGSYNSALGVSALHLNTTGSYNSAVGLNALNANTTYANCSGLGYNAQITGDNQVQLGNSSTTTYAYGAVQNRSDARDKTDIRDTVLGLDFINQLRPVDFKWDMREDYRPPAPALTAVRPSIVEPVAPETPEKPPKDATEKELSTYATAREEYNVKLAEYEAELVIYNKAMDEYAAAKVVDDANMAAWIDTHKLANIEHDGSRKRTRYHHGLIAQEVETILSRLGIDFGGIQYHKIAGGDDCYSLGYTEFIAPLIRAVQQLSARVKALEGAA